MARGQSFWDTSCAVADRLKWWYCRSRENNRDKHHAVRMLSLLEVPRPCRCPNWAAALLSWCQAKTSAAR